MRCFTEHYPSILPLIVVLVGLAATAGAQWDPLHEAYSGADGVPMSLFCRPDGGGNGFDECYVFGQGHPDYDATITLILYNWYYDPIPDYPAEDMWLETEQGGMVACAGGTIADGDTDVNGMTTFSQPLRVGGQSNYPEERMIVMVSGAPILHPGFEIYVNSPDLDGDLVVDLVDAILFAQDYFAQNSAYRSDFWWDGYLNLSDLVLMAQGYGTSCLPD